MAFLKKYLSRIEQERPGVLADEATTISRVGVLASLAELALHAKFGTSSGIITSAVTAVASTSMLWGVNRHYANKPLQEQLFGTPALSVPHRLELAVDCGGALMLTGMVQSIGLNVDVFTHAHNLQGAIAIDAGAIVLGIGGLVGAEFLLDKQGQTELLTSEPISGTIDQLEFNFTQEDNG